MMPDVGLVVDEPCQGVVRLQLARPERRNSLSTSLLAAIADELDRAERNPEARAALIVGGEKVFAAGADIAELSVASGDEEIETPRFRAWATIRAFQKPLLAGVEGWCLGAGLELAMCCDMVVAGASARFGQPETNLGIIPGAGGTATLCRLVGRALAMRMVLLGEPIAADRALAGGLVCDVVEEGMAATSALALAATIAARAPLAMRAAKASIRESSELSGAEHIWNERRRFVALLGTDDKREGVSAFLEKRAPSWRGN